MKAALKPFTAALALVLLALRRLMPTVAIVLVVNFFLLQLAPGDAADVLAAESGSATAETMAAIRSSLGLDLSVGQQFLAYLNGLLHFDLGYSARFARPVLDVILDRLPSTLLLMGTALGMALIVGVLLGVWMGMKQGKLTDRILSVIVLIFYSIPSFWGALMFIILFSVKLGWLPVSGYKTIGMAGTQLELALDILKHLVLPAASLGLLFVAIFARLARASILDVIQQDYIRTAYAKGLSKRRVMFVHVLRNALIPVTTVAGVNFGLLFGGAIVTETVFSWPGLGTLAFGAVSGRDYHVLLGLLLFSSVLVIVVNILTDTVQGWLDPRTRRI